MTRARNAQTHGGKRSGLLTTSSRKIRRVRADTAELRREHPCRNQDAGERFQKAGGGRQERSRAGGLPPGPLLWDVR